MGMGIKNGNKNGMKMKIMGMKMSRGDSSDKLR